MPEHPLLDDGQPPEDPSQEDHSGFDKAVAVRERIHKERKLEGEGAVPRTELMDLQELARRIGAAQNAQGWLLPFYHAAGKKEMVPLEDWLERRRMAAEVLRPIDTGLMNKLECGCYNQCMGHKEFEPIGLTQAEVDEKVRADKLREAYLQPLRDREHMASVRVQEDNWAHRSDAMRCRTCMFYVPKTGGREIVPGVVDRQEIGRCRHSAPTLKGWPAIFPTDWCGAHKLDETKI